MKVAADWQQARDAPGRRVRQDPAQAPQTIDALFLRRTRAAAGASSTRIAQSKQTTN